MLNTESQVVYIPSVRLMYSKEYVLLQDICFALFLLSTVCTLSLDWHIPLIVMSVVFLIAGGAVAIVLIVYKIMSELHHSNCIAGLFCCAKVFTINFVQYRYSISTMLNVDLSGK